MIELTIRSASEQRILNEVIKENERRLQEAQMECIVQEIFNLTKEMIESHTDARFGFYLQGLHVMQIFGIEREYLMTEDAYNTVEKCLPIVQKAFEGFGYKVTFTIYSQSWRRKSGKIACINVEY